MGLKMLKSRNLLAVCFCFFGVIQELFPQATGDNLISVEFSCLAWSQVDTKGLRYLDGEKVEPLRISSAYRTGPYRYRGTNPIVVFREVAGPEGAVIRQPVGRAFVDPSFTKVLFLFIRNDQPEGSGSEYEIMVLDDSLDSFPRGAYRIFNLSNHQIGGFIGKEKFIVPTKEFRTIELDSEDKVDVQIHFSSRVEDQWVPGVNTRWLYRDNMRSIVFVTADQESRYPMLKVKSVKEYLED